MRHLTCFSLVFGFLLATHAADWPGWRGPSGTAVSMEKNLPTHWSKDENLAWKTSLSGKGASSPVVVGNRIYLTTQTTDTGLHALALDTATGAIVWDREVAKGNVSAHKLHNMATPTAVSDGQSIWVQFGTGDFACLNRDGKVLWHRNLVKEYGEFKTNHGYGSSPILLDGRIYVACMHQGSSYLLAVDARTGKNLWKKDRNLGPTDEAQDSYSSPLPTRADGRDEIVLAGAESLNAYDPSTGEQLWIRGGFKVPHPYGRTIAGATFGEGVIVAVASGFQNRGFTVGVKAGGKGVLTDSPRLWTSTKFSPDCPTPVIYQGKVYFIRDDGIASCLDLMTGEAHWQERLYSANVKVSPVAGDGKIYFMNGEGNCAVVKAATRLEVLATNSLNEATLSTPAISQGRLFIRTEGHLLCVKN